MLVCVRNLGGDDGPAVGRSDLVGRDRGDVCIVRIQLERSVVIRFHVGGLLLLHHVVDIFLHLRLPEHAPEVPPLLVDQSALLSHLIQIPLFLALRNNCLGVILDHFRDCLLEEIVMPLDFERRSKLDLSAKGV